MIDSKSWVVCMRSPFGRDFPLEVSYSRGGQTHLNSEVLQFLTTCIILERNTTKMAYQPSQNNSTGIHPSNYTITQILLIHVTTNVCGAQAQKLLTPMRLATTQKQSR